MLEVWQSLDFVFEFGFDSGPCGWVSLSIIIVLNEVALTCIVIFSGGQDSTTLALLARESFSVHLLGFDYSQKHSIELECSQNIAKKLNLPYTCVKMDFLDGILESSLLASSQIAPKDLKKATFNATLPSTYVPNRNALFLTLAHAYAQKISSSHIALGVASDDHTSYPDCRLEFISALERALNLGANSQIKFHTPLLNMDKATEFAIADELGQLELILESTHTCYEGVREMNSWGAGCGRCGACILRESAFLEFKGNQERYGERACEILKRGVFEV